MGTYGDFSTISAKLDAGSGEDVTALFGLTNKMFGAITIYSHTIKNTTQDIAVFLPGVVEKR